MKKATFLFLFLSLLAFQVSAQPTLPSSLSALKGLITTKLTPTISGTLVDKITAQKIQDVTNALADAISQRTVQVADIASLTALSGGVGNSVQVRDVQRGGLFTYSASGYTVDNGIVFPALGGGYWVRQFFGRISAPWYGAKGDNATNENVAFSAAAAAATSRNTDLFVPKGTYLLTTSVGLTGAHLIGESRTLTVLKFSTTVGFQLYDLGGVENCTIQSTYNGPGSGDGWVIQVNGKDCLVNNCIIQGQQPVCAPNRVTNLVVTGNTMNLQYAEGYGVQLVDPLQCRIENNVINANVQGQRPITLQKTSEGNVIRGNIINGNLNCYTGVLFNNDGASGSRISSITRHNVVENNQVFNIREEAISFDFYLKSAYNRQVGKFTESTATAVYIDGATGRTIIADTTLRGVFATGSLNLYYLLVVDGPGAGQYSYIDINFDDASQPSIWLHDPLPVAISAGTKYLIGNFSHSNKIIGNTVNGGAQNGILLYGVNVNTTIENNTVRSTGWTDYTGNTTYQYAAIGVFSVQYAGNPFDSQPVTLAPSIGHTITNNTLNRNKYGISVGNAKYSNLSGLISPTKILARNNQFVGNGTDLPTPTGTSLNIETSYLSASSNLSDLSSASTARTNLGLTSMATMNPASVTLTGGTIAGVTLTGTTETAPILTTPSVTNMTHTGTLVLSGNLNLTASSPQLQIAGNRFFHTTGTQSAFLGTYAGSVAQSGNSNNNAHGYSAMNNLTTGANNAAFGSAAGFYFATAGNNAAFGHNAAGASSFSGAVGISALGYNAGLNAGTGMAFYNTYLGYNAGSGEVSQTKTTFVGNSSDNVQSMKLYGNYSGAKIYGTESLTAISAGAGAGTGATVSVNGTSLSGTVTITTGTTPSAGVLAVLTFPSAYGTTPVCVVSAAQGSTLQVGTINSSTTGFSINALSTPSGGTTGYVNYICTGKP